MKKYECEVCGYIYDPAVGDPEHNIAPGTPFEKLPCDTTITFTFIICLLFCIRFLCSNCSIFSIVFHTILCFILSEMIFTFAQSNFTQLYK